MALLAAGALGFGLSSQQAQAVVLNFSSDAGADVTFDGTTDKFGFNNGIFGRDFQITLSSGGVGDALGLKGNLTGDFTIGAITSVMGLETAPVTSVGGIFSIFDGVTSLTANVDWIEIATEGTGGIINAGGVLNVSNIMYGGTVLDLIDLATTGVGTGTAALTFQFVPAKSLKELTTDGSVSTTSYSGTITSVPDGGSTLALLGVVLFGAAGLRRKLKTA